jgi:hypothetical protein
MSNIRKSFNLRNGVQVDDDNFIVNPNGLVGIGTSIPDASLDVRGSVKVVGVLTANNALFENQQVTRAFNVGITSITSGIIAGSSGVVTYYGDGGKLLNLPTSQWLDVDVGLGFTSIYAQGFVGVGTVDPRYLFQVGGNDDPIDFQLGVGINERGDINATGIITAYAFSGSGVQLTNLDGSNITSGTISVDRLPIIPEPKLPNSFQVSGIITALGGFSGIAFTAANLTPDARVSIDYINSQTAEIGISTISTRLNVLGTIGVNTDSPQSNIHLVGDSNARLQVTGTQSFVLTGRGLNPTQNTGGLKFGNTSGLFPYSNGRTLDIINYDTGNINYYLDYGISGSLDGKFNWLYGSNASNPLMTLTHQGNLGLGVTNPTSKLQVSGNINASSLNVSGNVVATSAGSSTSVRTLYVYGGKNQILDENGSELFPVQSEENLYLTSGISTFSNLLVSNKFAISSAELDEDKIIANFQIGDAINNPQSCIIINGSVIGIGTTQPISDIDAQQSLALFKSVGIGTTDPEGELDLVGTLLVRDGNIGVGTTNPTSALTVKGNTSLETLSISGITTSTGGFTSGIGTAVEISTVGNQLVFTVPGVGTTSLTLF